MFTLYLLYYRNKGGPGRFFNPTATPAHFHTFTLFLSRSLFHGVSVITLQINGNKKAFSFKPTAVLDSTCIRHFEKHFTLK